MATLHPTTKKSRFFTESLEMSGSGQQTQIVLETTYEGAYLVSLELIKSSLPRLELKLSIHKQDNKDFFNNSAIFVEATYKISYETKRNPTNVLVRNESMLNSVCIFVVCFVCARIKKNRDRKYLSRK